MLLTLQSFKDLICNEQSNHSFDHIGHLRLPPNCESIDTQATKEKLSDNINILRSLSYYLLSFDREGCKREHCLDKVQDLLEKVEAIDATSKVHMSDAIQLLMDFEKSKRELRPNCERLQTIDGKTVVVHDSLHQITSTLLRLQFIHPYPFQSSARVVIQEFLSHKYSQIKYFKGTEQFKKFKSLSSECILPYLEKFIKIISHDQFLLIWSKNVIEIFKLLRQFDEACELRAAHTLITLRKLDIDMHDVTPDLLETIFYLNFYTQLSTYMTVTEEIRAFFEESVLVASKSLPPKYRVDSFILSFKFLIANASS